MSNHNSEKVIGLLTEIRDLLTLMNTPETDPRTLRRKRETTTKSSTTPVA